MAIFCSKSSIPHSNGRCTNSNPNFHSQYDDTKKSAKFVRQAIVKTIPSYLDRFISKIRTIPIRIITAGKKRDKGIQLVAEDYMEKIKHYCVIEDFQIKSNPKNTSDISAQIEGADGIIMQHIKPNEWVVMLDEKGADIGSEQMAKLVEGAGLTGSSRISFCIGGPYGHGPQLRKRADVVIRLSTMVLNHQIAFIVLLEQIYRAWTILKGQKYHH